MMNVILVYALKYNTHYSNSVRMLYTMTSINLSAFLRVNTLDSGLNQFPLIVFICSLVTCYHSSVRAQVTFKGRKNTSNVV